MTSEKIIWKTYPEYPFIEANQFGEVRTRDRTVVRKDGTKQFVKGHILKQYPQKGGYMQVIFSVNNKKVHLYVHRIIAICFVPNPDNLPEVNHKDNDPANNIASNLEWCTSQYNIDYKKNFGTSASELFGHSVIAINSETSEVFRFESQHEAARHLGVDPSTVTKVVKGKRNKVGNSWFCNVDENAVEKVRDKFGDEVADKVEKLMKVD